MMFPRLIDNQRGVALITVVLVALAVSSVAVAASMMTMSGTLVRKYSERASMANHAASSGVELGLSALLADGTLYPTTGYTTLEDSVPVLDAMGNPIPRVRRSIYIGPSSDPSRGSIVSEVWTRGGVRAVRRLEVAATSFASFGQFMYHDHSGVEFTATDDQYGPIHSNGDINIGLPVGADSAMFLGSVTVVGSIINPGRAVFVKGFTEGVSLDSLPTTSDLGALRNLAISGGLLLPGLTGGAFAATTRVEFIAVDMDGNTATTNDVEGFVRVYRNAADARNLMAWQLWGNPIDTPNCGVWDGLTFKSFPNGGFASRGEAENAIDFNQYRCYLGGDPVLNNGNFSATPPDGGMWLPWTGPAVPPGAGFNARTDKAYLHPYTPGVNPNTTGVIYVDGDVAVSGVVRGKVTLVSKDDILIVDDLVQHTDPGANACGQDLLGLVAHDEVAIADNTLNTPQRYGGGGTGDSYHTMSATKDEYVHAIIMALDDFTVSNATGGPDAADNLGLGAEPCEGVPWGRGCLYITGGLLRRHRKPDDFGTVGGKGYQLRLSYNGCVQQGAPPHFPATGSFKGQRIVEMEGATFDPVTWFANYQS